jgi:4-hydroxythreonine-4-phosphate dehydrogenase
MRRIYDDRPTYYRGILIASSVAYDASSRDASIRCVTSSPDLNFGSMRKPLLAITQGDPAGVGPETIVGALLRPEIHHVCRAVFVGNPRILQRAIDLKHADLQIEKIDEQCSASQLEQIESSPRAIPCLSCGSDEALEVPAATVDARGGQAAYDALVKAAQWALAGRVDGIVTAPLNKAALWRAGHHYPGHTELLAELCGVNDFAMMLFLRREGGAKPLGTSAPHPGPLPVGEGETRGLGVVHVTLHMALADIFRNLTTESIVSKAKLIDNVITKLNGARPHIGVCALNPHAGEDGLFGDEERRIIAPAVAAAGGMGLSIAGPLPADTLLLRASEGQFDAVVAMYHDQGHIAIKLLGMHRAVNITLGLPIVRTSVAHGTAFDLAWQGRAEITGMVEAIHVAARLTQ